MLTTQTDEVIKKSMALLAESEQYNADNEAERPALIKKLQALILQYLFCFINNNQTPVPIIADNIKKISKKIRMVNEDASDSEDEESNTASLFHRYEGIFNKTPHKTPLLHKKVLQDLIFSPTPDENKLDLAFASLKNQELTQPRHLSKNPQSTGSLHPLNEDGDENIPQADETGYFADDESQGLIESDDENSTDSAPASDPTQEKNPHNHNPIQTLKSLFEQLNTKLKDCNLSDSETFLNNAKIEQARFIELVGKSKINKTITINEKTYTATQATSAYLRQILNLTDGDKINEQQYQQAIKQFTRYDHPTLNAIGKAMLIIGIILAVAAIIIGTKGVGIPLVIASAGSTLTGASLSGMFSKGNLAKAAEKIVLATAPIKKNNGNNDESSTISGSEPKK